MCYSVFLGCADRLHETAPWSQASATFALRCVDGHPEFTRECRLIDAPHTYRLQSHEGCGCGFCYASTAEFDAGLTGASEAAQAEARSDRLDRCDALANLRDAMERATARGPVRMLVYWDEPPATGVVGRDPITPDLFAGDEFALEPGLFDVRPPEAA